MVVPRWVDAADDASGESSDSESDIADPEVAQVQQRQVLETLQEGVAEPSKSTKASKISIKLAGSNNVCHVCGKSGHVSGFFGSVYVDCINKPCYLCGVSGHSTSTCPHRFAPELACTAAADVSKWSTLRFLFNREITGRAAGSHSLAPKTDINWAIDSAVLKLHARRTTCLEFHPVRDDIVLSGDKKGQIAIWNIDTVFERTVYTDINKWLTNGLKFMPAHLRGDTQLVTSSYDGTVKLVDYEIGTSLRTLVDANPQGWEHVEEDDKLGRWITFIGLDVMPSNGIVVAGDSHGSVYVLDHRVENHPVAVLQAHKKKSKVQSVSIHPTSDFLILTAGNDYHARLLDARKLGSIETGALHSISSGSTSCSSVAEIASFPHPRVINSAYFSPMTGRKILTTAQDNRMRVWDNFSATLGDGPDREIIHSHNFNRHLTAFKAEWDPKDPYERLACIGRYISEDYGGMALHPIDLFDCSTGALVGELTDPNLTTISPVNKPHPRQDIIITGSSRSLYCWKLQYEDENEEQERKNVDREMNPTHAKLGSNQPRGSSNFMFFDADDTTTAKKKRAAKNATTTSAKTLLDGASRSGSTKKRRNSDDASDDDEDA